MGSDVGRLIPRADSYLEYPLVIDLIEDRPVDLVWFQGDPVKDGHTELCLDGFLDLNRCTGNRRVNTASLNTESTHTHIHTRAGEGVDSDW